MDLTSDGPTAALALAIGLILVNVYNGLKKFTSGTFPDTVEPLQKGYAQAKLRGLLAGAVPLARPERPDA